MHTPQCSEKSYVVAVCLSGVFGLLGVQHFYLGRWAHGFADVGMTIGFVTLYLRGQELEAAILFGMDSIHTIVVTFALLVGAFRDGDGKVVCYPGQKPKS